MVFWWHAFLEEFAQALVLGEAQAGVFDRSLKEIKCLECS
jgi:hypothetical protein